MNSAMVDEAAISSSSRELPGHELAWLLDLREEARSRLAADGFPTKRDEEWKYTDPSVVTNPEYAHDVSSESDLVAIPELGLADAHRLVLVDGRLDRERSVVHALPDGVVVTGLADALEECPDLVRAHLGTLAEVSTNGFVAENTVLFADGAFVLVPEGVSLDRPVLVISNGTADDRPRVAHVRSLVAVGAHGRATIVTAHASEGSGTYFTNAVIEAIAGEDAEIEHVQVDLGAPGSFLVDHQVFRAERSARIRTRHVSLGHGWVRGDLRAILAGEGADCVMTGLTVATDDRHVDFHTTIDHAMPHGHSDERFKTIADGKSTGVFRGRIIVREDAQKTDAKQTNRNLVLSDEAKVWTRPQLEIYADDVKCTHGATIGRLDEEGLFYLRSRGIDEATARRLLLTAFAGEIVDAIPHEGLRERLRGRLERRLPDGGEIAG